MAASDRDRCARKHEPDRIRQTQTAGGERDQDRKAKKAQRAKQQNIHGAQFSGAPRKENRGPMLFGGREIGASAQIALGIDRLAVDPHLVVQMRPGRAASRTELA